jgi:hypothetical protein
MEAWRQEFSATKTTVDDCTKSTVSSVRDYSVESKHLYLDSRG